MAQFNPWELESKSIDDQFVSWNEMIKPPYDKNNVDPYTRCRVILMNGIETNAVLTSHNLDRLIDNSDIKKQLAMIRRADSLQQQTVNWLNPANQTVVETTIGYEQVAVDLTANLAKNESDSYFKQCLDFALLEDFDHLFRYGCLMELLEGKDPNSITQGCTEIKPGRPTVFHHRHPFDEMRKHFDAEEVPLKSWMNYFTIVSGEQQTQLFYKAHGNMYPDDLARKLYSEIADVEQQHVTQYEQAGDPRLSPLLMFAVLQLNEAYNYFSCAVTETDTRIKKIWEEFCASEIEHFKMCNDLMNTYEDRDFRDLVDSDVIEPLIVFEPNKEYVNKILETQVQLEPIDMEFKSWQDMPKNWPSFGFRDKVNAGEVPSDMVVKQAENQSSMPMAA